MIFLVLIILFKVLFVLKLIVPSFLSLKDIFVN